MNVVNEDEGIYTLQICTSLTLYSSLFKVITEERHKALPNSFVYMIGGMCIQHADATVVKLVHEIW